MWFCEILWRVLHVSGPESRDFYYRWRALQGNLEAGVVFPGTVLNSRTYAVRSGNSLEYYDV